jgi:hypothetical protein
VWVAAMEFRFAPNVNMGSEQPKKTSEMLEQLVSAEQESPPQTRKPHHNRLELPPYSQHQQETDQKQVEEEEKEAAEPSKKAAWIITPGMILRYILVLCFLALSTVVLIHVIYHGMSVKDALVITFSSSAKGGSGKYVYPIWDHSHDTKSAPLDLRELYARPLLSSLEHSFRIHMETTTQYPCLCMHHIAIVSAGSPLFRVCAVYNRPRSELILFVNPSIIGQSNQTDPYGETSISCPKEKQRPTTRRARQIVLEWTDPETWDTIYSKFSGTSSVCMQLALDEFEGTKHCTK